MQNPYSASAFPHFALISSPCRDDVFRFAQQGRKLGVLIVLLPLSVLCFSFPCPISIVLIILRPYLRVCIIFSLFYSLLGG